MTPYIFIGPTLPAGQARQVLDAVYLPPVRQGDVYRLVTLRRPPIIGIVDGYFNQVPAVWHKEILWAMAVGVHVLGAASMGALRAAELAPFGMQGVGVVFEAYRDGVLSCEGGEPFEDDDEVAVSHAPAELGYRPLSEAMVNIRCTLVRAMKAGVITPSTRNALVQRAKALFYTERCYERLIELAIEGGLPAVEIDALAQWLPEGKCDLKRDDALALLGAVREHMQGGVGEKIVDYTFQHSVQWELATATVLAERPESARVLEELRLEGAAYFAWQRKALRRLVAPLADGEGPRRADSLEDELESTPTQELDATLRELHDKPAAVEALWRQELFRRELHEAVTALPLPLLERHLMALLRETGDYQRLEARASHKDEILAACATSTIHAELSDLQALQLHDWYFEQCLHRAMPRDIEDYVERLGFTDMEAFNRALLSEYIYRNRQRRAATRDQAR